MLLLKLYYYSDIIFSSKDNFGCHRIIAIYLLVKPSNEAGHDKKKLGYSFAFASLIPMRHSTKKYSVVHVCVDSDQPAYPCSLI